MSKSWRGNSYPQGTRVQHRNGYIFVKVQNDEGEMKLMAEGRRVWELRHGPLEPGDKVYHMDGDRTNNDVRNLAKIHFNQTKFTFLKESKVLFMPTIRVLDKKTGKVLVNS